MLLLTFSAGSGDIVELRPREFVLSQATVQWVSALPPASYVAVRGATKQANLDGFPISLSIDEPGTNFVGADFQPRQVPIQGELMRLLSITQISAGATMEERASASCLLLRSGQTDIGPSAIASSRLGLRFEIRPLIDPTVATPGTDIPMRLYWEGDALKDCLVRLSPIASRKVHSGGGGKGRAESYLADPADWISKKTDADGFVALRLPSLGAWRMMAIHSTGSVVYTATLCFKTRGTQ